MNYSYMKAFYVVVKHQNISLAAKELGVTQPALSRIIANIENEYGTKLFFRSKNGVTLTREGLNLFEMIKRPFTELEKIDNTISSTKNLKESIVHIGATSTALYCYLFKYLDEIKKKFPSIKFRLYTDSSVNLLNMAENGSIDIAFITTPFNAGEDMEVHNVYKLNSILIAPISYKDRIKGKVSIKELVKYPFILLSKDMQFRQHINTFLYGHGIRINPEYEIDSSSILIPLVENDCGLTFIPDEMAEQSIKENKCFKVDLVEDIPLRFVSLVIKKDINHASAIYEIKDQIIKIQG